MMIVRTSFTSDNAKCHSSGSLLISMLGYHPIKVNQVIVKKQLDSYVRIIIII